jgi:uncharacterized protein YxeA
MSNRILKWVAAGALYLAVVIGAYSVYDNTYGKENQKTVHQDHGTQTEEHSPSHEEKEKDDHQQEGHKEIPSGEKK